MAKSPEAFRTISEAASELGVPQHVLRFWETKFSFIRPLKRAGGRRFYRPADIAVLASVRRLLHDEGLTIKGVQKLHRETGVKGFGAAPVHAANDDLTDESLFVPRGDAGADHRPDLRAALADLEAAKARLDRLLDKP